MARAGRVAWPRIFKRWGPDMDWQALLKTVAPWIGTAIAGPLGGMALTAAGAAFGISKPTTERLEAALAGMSPEQSIALQSADQTFQAHMAELGYKSIADLEALAAADRKDARAMQIAKPSRVPAILTVIVTVGYFGVLFGMMSQVLHIQESQVGLMMLGSLTTAWGTCLAYWLGTTRDSARKTDLLAQSKPAGE